MSFLGTNYDDRQYDDHSAELQNIAKLGLKTVRFFPLTHDRDMSASLDMGHRVGLQNILTYAGQSQTGNGIRKDIEAYTTQYRGLFDYFQFGNEPDQDPHAGGSSWIMSQAECADHLKNDIPQLVVPLLSPGFSSGNYLWVTPDMVRWDFTCFHPYGKWPSNAAVRTPSGGIWGAGDGDRNVDILLTQYFSLGKPLWLDEFGAPDYELAQPGLYMNGMCTRFLTDPRVYGANQFSYQGVHGFELFTGGKPTAYADAIKGVTAVIAQSIPKPPGGLTVPDPFVIDADTRKALSDKGWTPAESYVESTNGGHVVCKEGVCYWLNVDSPEGVFRFLPFE